MSSASPLPRARGSRLDVEQLSSANFLSPCFYVLDYFLFRFLTGRRVAHGIQFMRIFLTVISFISLFSRFCVLQFNSLYRGLLLTLGISKICLLPVNFSVSAAQLASVEGILRLQYYVDQ